MKDRIIPAALAAVLVIVLVTVLVTARMVVATFYRGTYFGAELKAVVEPIVLFLADGASMGELVVKPSGWFDFDAAAAVSRSVVSLPLRIRTEVSAFPEILRGYVRVEGRASLGSADSLGFEARVPYRALWATDLTDAGAASQLNARFGRIELGLLDSGKGPPAKRARCLSGRAVLTVKSKRRAAPSGGLAFDVRAEIGTSTWQAGALLRGKELKVDPVEITGEYVGRELSVTKPVEIRTRYGSALVTGFIGKRADAVTPAMEVDVAAKTDSMRLLMAVLFRCRNVPLQLAFHVSGRVDGPRCK